MDSIGTGKIWAATLQELEENARHLLVNNQIDAANAYNRNCRRSTTPT